MASISAVMGIEFSLNRSKSPTRLFSKSGPVRRLLFSGFYLNVEAAFETRRTFPSLLVFLGLVTGWCGRYQTRSGVMSLKVTDLTYPFFKVSVECFLIYIFQCFVFLEFLSRLWT